MISVTSNIKQSTIIRHRRQLINAHVGINLLMLMVVSLRSACPMFDAVKRVTIKRV